MWMWMYIGKIYGYGCVAGWHLDRRYLVKDNHRFRDEEEATAAAAAVTRLGRNPVPTVGYALFVRSSHGLALQSSVCCISHRPDGLTLFITTS